MQKLRRSSGGVDPGAGDEDERGTSSMVPWRESVIGSRTVTGIVSGLRRPADADAGGSPARCRCPPSREWPACTPVRCASPTPPSRRTSRPGRGRLDLGALRGGRDPRQGPARGRPRLGRDRPVSSRSPSPRASRTPVTLAGCCSAPARWDPEGRESSVRLDRLLAVAPEAVRREGAALDRARYDAVVAALAHRRSGLSLGPTYGVPQPSTDQREWPAGTRSQQRRRRPEVPSASPRCHPERSRPVTRHAWRPTLWRTPGPATRRARARRGAPRTGPEARRPRLRGGSRRRPRRTAG